MQPNTYALCDYGVVSAIHDAGVSGVTGENMRDVLAELRAGHPVGVQGDSGIELKFVPVGDLLFRTYKIYH